MHIGSISVPVILRGLELYVRLLNYFNFHTNNIPFVTGCVHRNYVDFIMLITWMSGRGGGHGKKKLKLICRNTLGGGTGSCGLES